MTRTTENTIVALVVLVALAGLAAGVRWFVVARSRTAYNSCINNLRQMDSATQSWALEQSVTSNAVVTLSDLGSYLKGGVPKCPEGGVYTVGRVIDRPRCSIMQHNIEFGYLSVADESDVPLADARVAVLGRGAEICSAQTSTNGELDLFEGPRSGLRDNVVTNSWSDGTKQIVAWKEGYRTSSIALPTSDWPVRFVLTNQVERPGR
jgi:hypothetical protein